MSKKNKTVYVCNECGYESAGWLGKCPACLCWNTFVEYKLDKEEGHKNYKNIDKQNTEIFSITDIVADDRERYSTGIGELDRVLGGGIVESSLILIGGDPGIGKSTLIMQMCNEMDLNIIYISGEESAKQLKMRADRLGVKNKKILIAAETNIKSIELIINENSPKVVVIDSIQTMYNEHINSSPGSVSQVREVTAQLLRIAKEKSISIIIVGHVTKEGALAGPRVLEHMVDVVLYFEGERHQNYRIVRGVKNRFGSTNEIGIFEMREKGLVEVENPSLFMLNGRPSNVPGSIVVAGLEGTRPMLVEIQALVCNTVFGIPKRMASGLDYNRVAMLMAVLEKRLGLQLSNCDAYVNVVGGIKIDEPACDLGIISAIASSFKNIPIDDQCVIIGEVGLTGEIRSVTQIEKRLFEAQRIGFKSCIIPYGNYKMVSENRELLKIKIIPVSSVNEALKILL